MAFQSPDLSAKVEDAFGEEYLVQAHADMQAWLKGAIDMTLPTATHFAEENSAGKELQTFESIGGDEDLATGMLPAVERHIRRDSDGDLVMEDPTGLLSENDKYPIDLQPHEIKGPEAHVALVALCAAAKKDRAAEDLLDRMDLSAPSRFLHEAALADSRIVSRSAAALLRLF
ncbi:MAG TPA: hypothetical protein VK978_01265 [Candidatus Saccharimonadales bacterium]|nr:hypothetical protein [Candidatus Saccharimonadales bacterium]